MASKIDFLFYCPDINQKKELDANDSQHCVKVLRKKKGDTIQVTDGKGGWYNCSITDPNPKACRFSVLEEIQNYNEPKRKISIAICPTKNADRIEYFVEKAVEIGVDEIFFVKTTHTYPKKINLERIKKIAVSGMKQSLKAYLPKLGDLIDFKDFMKQDFADKQIFIAHYDDVAEPLFTQRLSSEILIFIGPEGDYTKEEILIANEVGFKTVTLGSNRLRTETAGIVALSLLNLKD